MLSQVAFVTLVSGKIVFEMASAPGAAIMDATIKWFAGTLKLMYAARTDPATFKVNISNRFTYFLDKFLIYYGCITSRHDTEDLRVGHARQEGPLEKIKTQI